MKIKRIFIRLTHWEFWPAWISNLPVIFFWLWFSLKSRSFGFFAAANPSISTGGAFGESKFDILDQVNIKWKPHTIYAKTSMPLPTITSFPIVCKPNIGERGFQVKICKDEAELHHYHSNAKSDYLIQDYINYPMELSVLHYRFPTCETGNISSICLKEYLHVVGDGKTNVAFLMKQNNRTLLQIGKLRLAEDVLQSIPKFGEKVILSKIGNHGKGCKFINATHLISDELIAAFDKVSLSLNDIYFARYDLKCKSIEDLSQLKNFSILEINGITSEPAHIYDPNFGMLNAYRDLYKNWKMIYKISKKSKEEGNSYMNLSSLIKEFKKHQKLMKTR